jgi:hypothetical protein
MTKKKKKKPKKQLGTMVHSCHPTYMESIKKIIGSGQPGHKARQECSET